jgi:predicted Zn-dependent protease
MTRRALTLTALAAVAIAVGCSDIVAPARFQRYDWRLIVDFDSLGTIYQDTLTFHWPRDHIPVKIWVEDQYDVPARVREGIDRWRQAFLYGEWDAKIVGDSATADVIVRTIQPPPQTVPASSNSCSGATDVDTVATRFQMLVPVRVYIYPDVPNAPDITDCLRAVATHEIGHSLGILQHSTDANDIMFGSPAVQALSDRDIGTALNAYHFKADMVPVRP